MLPGRYGRIWSVRRAALLTDSTPSARKTDSGVVGAPPNESLLVDHPGYWEARVSSNESCLRTNKRQVVQGGPPAITGESSARAWCPHSRLKERLISGRWLDSSGPGKWRRSEISQLNRAMVEGLTSIWTMLRQELPKLRQDHEKRIDRDKGSSLASPGRE